MREKHQKQLPLMEPASDHPQEIELEIISKIIDDTPTICDYVLQDLNKGKIIKYSNIYKKKEKRFFIKPKNDSLYCCKFK